MDIALLFSISPKIRWVLFKKVFLMKFPFTCLAFTCKFKLLIGDGICHDATNTEFCDFDGGDCCLEETNTELCIDCICKETGFSAKHSNITAE